MGVSTAAAQAIFFIAVVAISAGLITVFTNYIDQAKSAMGDKQRYLSSQLRTEIQITNVYYNSPTLYVYVKNTGDETLDTNCIELYVNGGWATLDTSDIINPNTGSPADTWNSTSTIRLYENIVLGAGTQTVKAITCNGITDSLTFST